MVPIHVGRCAKTSSLLPYLLFIVYYGNVGILVMCSMCLFLFFGEIEPPLAQKIPGVDSKSLTGYIMILIWLVVQSLAVDAIHLYTDSTCATFAHNTSLFSGLIRQQIEQLNKMLAHKKMSKDSTCILLTFRNIIQMHIEMTE